MFYIILFMIFYVQLHLISVLNKSGFITDASTSLGEMIDRCDNIRDFRESLMNGFISFLPLVSMSVGR